MRIEECTEMSVIIYTKDKGKCSAIRWQFYGGQLRLVASKALSFCIILEVFGY